MIKPKKILIIGGNAAGPAAAAKAVRVNPKAEVIMFEAGKFISTGTCEIPYVLSGEIDNIDDIVYYNSDSFRNDKGVKVYTGHFVESINKKERKLVVRNLQDNSTKEFDYDSLILATGSRAKIHPILGSNFRNVSSLKSVSDLKKIKDYFQFNNVKSIAIIGSGYIGLETADALNNLGIKVTIFEKNNLPFPSTEIEIQHLLRKLLEKKNIEFYGNAENLKINSNDDKITSITFESRILEFDYVINTIGIEPNNNLAIQANLSLGKSGGLKVDRRLRTSDSNIFAAGDNIEVINAVTRKPDYFPIATIAHQFGHIAGENAAGGNIFSEPVVKNLAVKLFEKYYVQVGLTSVEAEKNKFNFDSVEEVAPNLVKVMPESEMTFGKILFEKNSKKIIGASFLGGKEVSGYGDLISNLIYTNQDAKILAKLNFNYTPPLSPFVNLLSILGRKIERK